MPLTSPGDSQSPKEMHAQIPPFLLKNKNKLSRQLAVAGQTLSLFKRGGVELFGHPVAFMEARFPVRQLRPIFRGTVIFVREEHFIDEAQGAISVAFKVS